MANPKTRLVASFALTAVLVVALAGPAGATTGYFSHGYGVKYKSMAGAGVAVPLSAFAPAINPGALAFVGQRYEVDLAVFSPDRSYTVTGTPSGPPAFGLAPGTYESVNNSFLIPGLAANWALEEENMAIGLAIYGNGGMNTEWQTNTFQGSIPTGVNLEQLFIATTMAYKAANKHGIGVTPILAYQRFQAEGLEAFGTRGLSSDPTKLTNNGHDSVWGFGFRIGYMGQLTEKFSIGGSYQSKVWMSRLDDYSGLYAEQGGFSVPSTWVVGVGITPREDLAIALDLQQIRYGDIKSIANPMLPNLQTALLGDDNGAGFGWVDILVFKAGVQYQSHETWTWRAGYSYNEQPIPDSEVMFNILAPGVQQHHIAFGFSHVLKERNDLSFSLLYSPSNTVKGPNPLDPAQTIELEMSEWEITLGYAFF